MTRTKPADNIFRVRRGGGWGNGAFVRAAYRDVVTPTYRYFNFGFRTAQSGCRQVLVNP